MYGCGGRPYAQCKEAAWKSKPMGVQPVPTIHIGDDELNLWGWLAIGQQRRPMRTQPSHLCTPGTLCRHAECRLWAYASCPHACDAMLAVTTQGRYPSAHERPLAGSCHHSLWPSCTLQWPAPEGPCRPALPCELLALGTWCVHTTPGPKLPQTAKSRC